MESLRKEIEEEIKKIEEMIANNESRSQIDIERKRLDELLERYVNDI